METSHSPRSVIVGWVGFKSSWGRGKADTRHKESMRKLHSLPHAATHLNLHVKTGGGVETTQRAHSKSSKGLATQTRDKTLHLVQILEGARL